jgi:hypothetical protein
MRTVAVALIVDRCHRDVVITVGMGLSLYETPVRGMALMNPQHASRQS